MPVSRAILCLVFGLLVAAAGGGCDQSSSDGADSMKPSAVPASAIDPREDEPVHVVATIFALGDLARQVGGKYAEVEWVIEGGRSLEGFEPSREMRERIGRAELVVAGGADEPWAVAEAPSGLAAQRMLRLDTLQLPAPSAARSSSAGDGSAPPGQAVGLPWLDPRVLSEAVDAVCERLVVLRPRHDVYFRSRAQRLKQELDLITDSHADELARLSRRRVLALTYEFDRLTARMGVGVTRPVVGSVDRLSDGQIGELRSAVRREQLPVLLVRADTPPALIADLSQRTGARVFTIDPYGSSASDSGRATVQEFLRYNLGQLVEAVKATQ